MVERNNLSGDKMKTIFLQVLIYMILGVSHLFAEEINKANVMFTYKFFYNNQIIQEGFLASNKKLYFENGKEESVLTHQCQKNENGQFNKLNVDLVKVNHYMILKCDDLQDKIVQCTVEFHNAVYNNALAQKEYDNKTCTSFTPEKKIKQFAFTLKHLENQQITLQDGYKLEYSLN